MQIRFRTPNRQPWATSHAYQSQVKNRTAICISDYSGQYRAYHQEVRRVAQIVQGHLPKVETVMLAGVGSSYEEVALITGNFPEVKDIHLVDWRKPNLEIVKHFFLEHPIQDREVNLTLHLADLRQPNSLEPESVDFAFANKVFDLFSRTPIDMQAVLQGIALRLKKGGFLFSFDYPFDPIEDHSDFYGLAEVAGLEKIADRVLRQTI